MEEISKSVDVSVNQKNELTSDEIGRLKSFLNFTYYEIPSLSSKIYDLEHENIDLKTEIEKLKNENCDLRTKISNLTYNVVENVNKFVSNMSATYIAENVSV